MAPIVQEAGWASGPVWTGVEKVQFLTDTGVRTPNRPARSEPLYRLRHPGPLTAGNSFFFNFFPPRYLPLPWRELWGSFTPAHCVINTAYQEKGKARSEPTAVSAPAFDSLCEAQECGIPDDVTFSLEKRAIIQYSWRHESRLYGKLSDRIFCSVLRPYNDIGL